MRCDENETDMDVDIGGSNCIIYITEKERNFFYNWKAMKEDI